MNRILFYPDAADATSAVPVAQSASVPLTEAQQKAIAVQAYYDAPTRDAKAAVVKQYPVLKTVFSSGNHS